MKRLFKSCLLAVLPFMATMAFADGINPVEGSATVEAKADKGTVFAGWYKDAEYENPYTSGDVDYRTPKMTYRVTQTLKTLHALFLDVKEAGMAVDTPDDIMDLVTGGSLPEDLIFEMVQSWSLPTVTVTGLPAGIKFDAKTLMLTGTATDKTPKWYDVKVTAKNVSGYTMSATFGVSVNGGEPAMVEIDEIGDLSEVDFSVLDTLKVGTPAENWQLDIPAEYKVTAKNLPTGLTMTGNTITGVPTKAGVFYVELTGTDPQTKAKIVTKKRVVIEDDYPIYITVNVNDEQGGTASGEGIYASGSTMKLTAKPNKDYVFEGWADPDNHAIKPAGVDYHQATYTAIVSGENTIQSFTACFAPKSKDTVMEIIPLKWLTTDKGLELMQVTSDKWNYGEDDIVEGNTQREFMFEAFSRSLPTVTVKGLPAGVTFNGEKDIKTFHWSNGTSTQVYRICVTDEKKLKPGEYKFTVSAKNQSGKTDEHTYTLKVPNKGRDELPLNYDEPYEVIPGKPFNAVEVLGTSDFGDWTVTGLPDGITFKNGVFSGAATKAGATYTVWFVNKSDKSKEATITMRTTAYPQLILDPLFYADNLAEGVTLPAPSAFKLTGGGSALVGKTMTIKATAPNKEWVFLRWQTEGGAPLSESETYTYTMTEAPTTTLKAVFIHISQDYLTPSEIAGAVYYPDNYNSEESVLKYVALASAVNEEVEIDVTSWFESATKTTLTFAGLPSGIKYEATSGYLTGKVSKAGCYYGTVTATNKSGYKLVIPIRFAVGDDVDTGEVDENGNLENLHDTFDGIQIQVGTCLIADLWLAPMIGGYDKDFGGVKLISGLPDSLKQYARNTGNPNWIEYLLDGKATKAAWYTVTYTTSEREQLDEKFVSGKAVAKVPVPQLESRYVTLVAAEGGGTVTGSGVWAPGAEYNITAKPDNGYVFAGWYKAYDEEFSEPANMLSSNGKTVNDYRTASQKVARFSLPDNEYSEFLIGDKLYAKFIPKAEADLEVKLIKVGNPENTVIEDGQTVNGGYGDVDMNFLVESDTAPTVTFVGLPKGVTVENGVDGIHVGSPSSSSSSAPIVPGRYPIKVTMENKDTGKKKIVNFILDQELFDWNGLFGDRLAFAFSMAEPLGAGETWNDKLGLNDELTAETWPDGTKETWTVKNLPNGLTFNAATGLITGSLKAVTIPTEYVVEFANTTKGSWGTYTSYSYCRITVEPLPAWTKGEFIGEVKLDDGMHSKTLRSTEALSVSATGALTGKVWIKDDGLMKSAYTIPSTAIGQVVAMDDVCEEDESCTWREYLNAMLGVTDDDGDATVSADSSVAYVFRNVSCYKANNVEVQMTLYLFGSQYDMSKPLSDDNMIGVLAGEYEGDGVRVEVAYFQNVWKQLVLEKPTFDTGVTAKLNVARFLTPLMGTEEAEDLGNYKQLFDYDETKDTYTPQVRRLAFIFGKDGKITATGTDLAPAASVELGNVDAVTVDSVLVVRRKMVADEETGEMGFATGAWFYITKVDCRFGTELGLFADSETGKVTEAEVMDVECAEEPLPAWATGTFYGGDTGGNQYTIVVAEDGKITGTYLNDFGVQSTVSANGFDKVGYDTDAYPTEWQGYKYSTMVKVANRGAIIWDTLEIVNSEIGGKARLLDNVMYTGSYIITAGELYKETVWTEAPWSGLAASFANASVAYSKGQLNFTLNFAANGKVSVQGATVSPMTVTAYDDYQGTFDARVYVLFPKSTGGTGCRVKLHWDGQAFSVVD